MQYRTVQYSTVSAYYEENALPHKIKTSDVDQWRWIAVKYRIYFTQEGLQKDLDLCVNPVQGKNK
jgi:hypothetical protein